MGGGEDGKGGGVRGGWGQGGEGGGGDGGGDDGDGDRRARRGRRWACDDDEEETNWNFRKCCIYRSGL